MTPLAGLLPVLGLFSAIDQMAKDPHYGEYTAYGSGVSSCGAYLGARQTGTDASYISWTLGYMTAVGRFNPSRHMKESDYQAFSAYLDGYCREHPLEKFGDAVGALANELLSPQAPPPQP